jgi:hypothetical protein
MPDYRLYAIGTRGHFESALELVAENDEAAIAKAVRAMAAARIELWCGARLVCECLGAEVNT